MNHFHSTSTSRGFSMVELLIATTIGLILIGAILSVYVAQFQLSLTTSSQAEIQSVENAISALVTPTIRSSGYSGCGALTQSSIPVLNAGGPPPLSTLSTTPSFVIGYDAVGTAGGGSAFTITQNNAANDANAADWLPVLDPTLAGGAEKGSDVLVLLGGVPNVSSVGVVSIPDGSPTMTLQSGAGLAVGQYGVVTDCLKSSVFKITGIAGNVITHAAGGNALDNASSTFSLSYPVGSTFIPIQQKAFYVAQGQGNQGSQSNLVQAVYTNGAWTVTPLVPGVDSMQVLYGIGAGGIISQYVAAGAVTNWAQVYAVRIGFLIQGQPGSSPVRTSGANSYSVLGTTVTAPNDGRLRHVYVMTVNLRNSS